MHGSGSLKWFMASALAVMAPGLAGAACVDDTSGLDQVLARYDGNKFTCSPRPATAGAGAIEFHCWKAPATGQLRRVLITATVDRASGCEVVTAVTEKPIRNTAIRGLCRKGRPCDHGDQHP